MTASAASAAVRKRFTTGDGTSYVYDYAVAQDSRPTVLLLHGYPSSRQDWRYQVEDLSAAGYGVLAPDLLGYGESDLPADIEAYHLKRLGGHLTEILDNEELATVVGVGHDWGSNLLSASYVWTPERFEKLAFLSVGYLPPGIFADVDAINAQGQVQLGYMQYGYWYFFNSYNAAELIKENIESAYHLLFPANNTVWKQHFAPVGAARAWLNSNIITPLPSYVSEEDKVAWVRRYSRPGAMAASLNYYKALLRGIQAADEATVTDEDRTLKVPVLAVGGLQDPVATPDRVSPAIEHYAVAGYQLEMLDTGHWMMLEQKENVSRILINFVRGKE